MVEFNRFAAGRVIRRIRKDKKLSQEVCSGLASLARSHLAKIESGDKQPNFETIWRISIALNMYPHELVRQVEEEAKHMELENLSTNPNKK